jgi:hypothetical protein
MRLKSAFAFAAIISFSTISGAAALDGPGRALIASNVLRLSADTPRTSTSAVGTGFKEFIVPYGGTVRVKWFLRSNETGKSVSVTIRSSIHECVDSTTSETYESQNCDLRVSAGDRVQASAIGAFDIGNPTMRSSVTLRNVRLHWNVVDSTGTGAVIAD